MTCGHNSEHYLIRLTAKEESSLALENLSAFLYDLVLLHDRLYMLLSPEYQGKIPSGLAFYRRNRRRIPKSDRLLVSLVTKESPLAIEIIIAAIIAAPAFILTFIKILEKISDFNNDRAIKRIDRKTKEFELQRLIRDEIERYLQRPANEAVQIENDLIKDAIRLADNEQLFLDSVKAIPIQNEPPRQS